MVCLWRLETGELLRRFTLPIGGPVHAAVSPNGKTLVIAGSLASDNVARVLIWDVDTGKMVGELPNPPPSTEGIIALSFVGENKTLATASGDSMLRLWDTETRKELRRFKSGRNLSALFAPSSDSKTLTLVRDDLERWDSVSGKQLHSYPLADREGLAMAFSPDGKLLATTNREKKLILRWDVASGKEMRRIHSDLEIILVLAFSPNGKTLAAGSVWEDDKIAKPCPIPIWDVNTGREVRRLSGPRSDSSHALVFAPDGKRLISCGLSGGLHIWDIESGKDILTFPAHEHNVNKIAFSPDGQLVATAGSDGTIRLWERATSKPIRVLASATRQRVRSIVFADKGKTLISCGKDGAIHYWDVKTGRERRKIVIDESEGISFICSPDGKTLAVYSLTGNLFLFDAATGKLRRCCKETTCAGFLCFSVIAQKSWGEQLRG